MPATSKFKIPFTDGRQANRRAIAQTSCTLKQKNNNSNNNIVHGSGSVDINRQSSFHDLRFDCNSNIVPPYQIIQVERHSYSMIKYTKMVTSVTFKWLSKLIYWRVKRTIQEYWFSRINVFCFSEITKFSEFWQTTVLHLYLFLQLSKTKKSC